MGKIMPVQNEQRKHGKTDREKKSELDGGAMGP